MRTLYDQLGKQVISAAVSRCGTAETEHEVSADVQRIDLWFVPDPEKPDRDQRLGLLGRMGQSSALFEFFHQPPTRDEWRACHRKQLMQYHKLQRANPRHEIPTLWIISAGRPRTLIETFGFGPLADWPEGVFALPEGFAVRLVVVAELPRTRETLLLRLLGSRRVLGEALQELATLGEDEFERLLALPIVVQLRVDYSEEPMSTDKEEFMAATEQFFQDFQRRLRQEGRAEGIEEGMEQGIEKGMEQGIEKGMEQGIEKGMEQGIEKGIEEGIGLGERRALLRMFGRKLGRPLAAIEEKALEERIERLGAEAVEQALLDADPDELAQWLTATP